jgi:2-methylcitrate dehydratase PrpD
MPEQHVFLSDFLRWATNPDLGFSADAITQARLSFLDTLACIEVGACQSQPVSISKAIGLPRISSSQAVVRRSTWEAPGLALFYGTAAHALDFDDYDLIASTHPSAVLVSTIVAINAFQQANLGECFRAYLVGSTCYASGFIYGNTPGRFTG